MVQTQQPIPSESIRLIVFDLDGTLIDSRKDLANSINAMLTEFHREPLPEEIIAEYIGDGAGMLVRRALGDPGDEKLSSPLWPRFLATIASTSLTIPMCTMESFKRSKP